jgi:tRNA pseudouridine38-40 synthase
VSDRKYKLIIAYDGSDYEGWQSRSNGRGIRPIISQACFSLWGSSPEIISSSRTDAGVHARGLVAHLSLPPEASRFTGPELRLALNAHLPASIRILSASLARASFHARFDARSKEYRYQVWNHPVMDPLLRAHAWHVPRPLDLNAMRQTAAIVVGRHDFRRFTVKRKGELLDSVRTLFACEIKRRGAMLSIHLIGEGFLYKMCRRIVGTLVQVGEGKISPSDIAAMLHSPISSPGGLVAPAQGLILWRVRYDGFVRKKES